MNIERYERLTCIACMWVAVDSFLYMWAHFFAYMISTRSLEIALEPQKFLFIVAALLPVWLILLTISGVYSLMHHQRSLHIGIRIVFAATTVLAVFTVAYSASFAHLGLGHAQLPPLFVTFFIPFLSLATWAAHCLVEGVVHRVVQAKPPLYPTLIISASMESAAFLKRLQQAHCPLTPIGIVDARGASVKQVEGVPVLGKLNKLEDLIRTHGITHVVHCGNNEQSFNVLQSCKQHGCTYLSLAKAVGIHADHISIARLREDTLSILTPKKRWSLY